jgi:hypothetical protein
MVSLNEELSNKKFINKKKYITSIYGFEGKNNE